MRRFTNRKYKANIMKNGAEVKVTPPENFTENSIESTIYKTCNIELNYQKVTKKEVEEIIKTVWGDMNFKTRGRRHGAIEVLMTAKEKAQPHTTTGCQVG